MRFDHIAAGLVIDGRFQILNERTAAPHVQRLRAVADGEDWLAKIEGVLQEQFIGCSANGIVGSAPWSSRFAIARGIDVVAAARQQNTVDAGEELGNAFARVGEMTTLGSAPAFLIAEMYWGSARALYSGSSLVGSGMAMRGGMKQV